MQGTGMVISVSVCDNVGYIAAKPTFIPGEELQNLEVVQGQDAKFTCLNKGTPNLTVQWSINGDGLDKREYSHSYLAINNI